jgi:hypothetical protein
MAATYPLHVLQEPRAHRAVHHPVIARDRHLHAAAHPELAVLHHRLLQHRAHREDRTLRGVDDGRELLDVVHAQVRDREGGPGHFLRAQFAPTRAVGQVPRLDRDAGERLRVAVA